jgi:hypothetical protein
VGFPSSEGKSFFSRDTVLNHLIGPSGTINPGEVIEGVLIGLCLSQRIPSEYLHGFDVPAELSIVDQFGNKHSGEIGLQIDRSATWRPLNYQRGTGLYGAAEGRDEIRVNQTSSPADEITVHFDDDRSGPTLP